MILQHHRIDVGRMLA